MGGGEHDEIPEQLHCLEEGCLPGCVRPVDRGGPENAMLHPRIHDVVAEFPVGSRGHVQDGRVFEKLEVGDTEADQHEYAKCISKLKIYQKFANYRFKFIETTNYLQLVMGISMLQDTKPVTDEHVSLRIIR